MKKMVCVVSVALLLAACSANDNTTDKSTDSAEQTMSNKGAEVVMNESVLRIWQGMIEIPQAPLEVILNLEKHTGSLSVPAQGLSDFAFESVDYEGDKVTIKIDLAGSLIKIVGDYSEEQIDSTFTQNGQTFPLTLKPFIEVPMTYEEIQIPVTGGQLKAALQMPDKPTGELVILHAGSGPTNKDGNTIGGGSNNSLKMLAEDLATEGIASIRFDKRGIGENTTLVKKEEELTLEAYVEDVSSIIKYSKQDDRFDEVHLIGHSEGALIMTLAAQTNEVNSLITLAGAGRFADVILKEQLLASVPPNVLKESTDILEKLKTGEQVSNIPLELQSLFRVSVQPYLISWLKYAPQEELAKIKIPVAVIQGKNDIQVTVDDAEALKAGNSSAELIYFDHMNHVLKDVAVDRARNIESYSNPDIPLALGLVESIVNFIR